MNKINRKVERERNHPGKGESGQVALIVVLTLLVLGAIILIPILLFMNTGLEAGQTHESRTQEFYSADAGVEDALWKIKADDLPDWMLGVWNETAYSQNYNYSISIGNLTNPINYKGVTVTIQPFWALEGLENQTAPGRTSNDTLVTLGSVIDAGKYQISLGNSTGNLTIDTIGCWLPSGFQYVTNSSNLQNSTQNYYCVPNTSAFRGGTAIKWDTWLKQTNQTIISFSNLTGPSASKKVVTFNFTLPNTPQGTFSWVKATYNNVTFLSWDVDCKIYKITSTASDLVTGKTTTVTAYTTKSEFRKVGGSAEGDYQATGNTLMRSLDSDTYGRRERLYLESPAQMSGIPAGASATKILLYWSGWKDTPDNVWYESNPDTSQWSPANQQKLLDLVSTYRVNRVQLKVQVGTSVFNQTITADPGEVQVLPNGNYGSPNGWSYSCCADVTNRLRGFFGVSFTGSANYTVGHVLPNFNGVWGSSSSNVFAVGDSGMILRYDGTAWSTITNVPTTQNLNGIWGNSTTNVYAVGDSGTILRYYNSTTWNTMAGVPTTQNLNGVWGISNATKVYAVGDSGTILRYNGTAWSNMTSGTTNTLYGVWGNSTTNVLYAVGAGGTILRYNGTAWSNMTSGTTNTLYGVWGNSTANVYAVGDSGTILRYNGSTWSAKTSNATNTLYSVWGISNTAYVVGASGTILRSTNGNTWSAMTSNTMNTLYGVWGTSTTNVYAVGASGTILRYTGSWGAMTSATLYNWDNTVAGKMLPKDYRLGERNASDSPSDTISEWAYAAWSVVEIYTSPQTKGHQLYLYDTFRYCDNDQKLTFPITNFLAPGDVATDNQSARITCFVGEGDNYWTGDNFTLNNYLRPSVSDGVNDPQNVWNSKSNVLPSAANDGIDIDTFFASSPIINPGDSQATVKLCTGTDSWNLVYIILSFRSETTSGGILTYLYGGG